MVLDVQGGVATVRLPDTSVETWSMASLPGGVLPVDRVGVTMQGSNLDLVLLPRLAGLQA